MSHKVDVLFTKIVSGQFYLSTIHYARNEVWKENPRKKKKDDKGNLLDETLLRIRRIARAMMITSHSYSVISGYSATDSGKTHEHLDTG